MNRKTDDLTDQQKMQGMWEVVSTVASGRDISSGTTHYHFEGDKIKAITPRFVNGGVWSTFELDEDARPRRITMTTHNSATDENYPPRIDCWAYQLEGDSLLLCWPNVFGNYP